MPADVGSQQVTIKYFDLVNSELVNDRFVGVRKTGIYSGGFLTKVSDVSVTVAKVVCEIADANTQVRVETTAAVNVTVAVATPWIILRWAYTGVATADYMELLAVAEGSITATDLVVGLCVFASTTLTGFNYALRSNAFVFDLFCKVEPTVAASLAVRVRGGRIRVGTASFKVVDQTTSSVTAPTANPRIDLVYLDPTDGSVNIATGSEAATPVAPTSAGRVPLAEILLATTTTSITIDELTDVREFLYASDLLDEDDFASDSDKRGATQQSIKAYITANEKDWLDTADIYDSGWFAVVQDTVYVKAHGLGTVEMFIELFFSTNTSGANMERVGEAIVSGGGVGEGGIVHTITTTALSVQSAKASITVANNWDRTTRNSGYYRVKALALA